MPPNLRRLFHDGPYAIPDQNIASTPTKCPACAAELIVSRLECPACGTEVVGAFRSGRLLNLPEPHASLLELFLRVHGNVKEWSGNWASPIKLNPSTWRQACGTKNAVQWPDVPFSRRRQNR